MGRAADQDTFRPPPLLRSFAGWPDLPAGTWRGDPMRLSRRLALGASTIAVAVMAAACSTGGGSNPTIKVGSVGFEEARIMAEAYAQVLEAAGYTVNRDGVGLGDRKVLLPALESGQIDLQPEYIGSGWAPGMAAPPRVTPTRTRRRSRRSSTARAAGSPSSTTRPARTRTRSWCAGRRRTSSG